MRSRAVFTGPGDVLLQGGYCPTKLLVPWGNWGPQYMFSPHDEVRLAFGPSGMDICPAHSSNSKDDRALL